MSGMNTATDINELLKVKDEVINENNESFPVLGDTVKTVFGTSVTNSGLDISAASEPCTSFSTPNRSPSAATRDNPETDASEDVKVASPGKKPQIKRERTVSASEASGPSAKKQCLSSSREEESKDDDKDGDDKVPGCSKTKIDSHDEERMKMQLLVSNFSEDQLNRYEMFRRAAFPKAAIKRLMQSIAGTSVSQSVVIAMSGIAKVYVGELVETALDVLEKTEEVGPLKPKHIREAVHKLRKNNGVPTTKHKKVLFR